jgi:hypothetical protein
VSSEAPPVTGLALQVKGLRVSYGPKRAVDGVSLDTLWERGYAAEARRSLLRMAQTLDDALAIVRPFVDALLQETATGQWNPKTQRWET